jgi:tungstate transport system ATP-binding protein
MNGFPAMSDHAPAVVELHGVCFEAAGRRILDGINLGLGKVPIGAIIGANGAGKTVLLRVAHGLLQPQQGTVLFEGRRAASPDDAFEGQALVFQHTAMLRSSVLDNLMLARHAVREPQREFRERALGMLERVGLSHLSGAPAMKLSGGERQRVAIARAWLTRPRLLLLDEPTASLDPTAREQVERLIGEIASSGCRVLMTSHQLAQVARLADEVVFLHRGQVLEQTGTEAFFRSPASQEAARFLEGETTWKRP